MKAVLLAGGKGTRLYPYTVALPKPLVPVGDRPIIDILLAQLKRHGILDVVISIGHLGEIIMAFLGDGSKLGMRISYVREETPLGTAGPLRLVSDLPDEFLMMNGDVLTDLDFGGFIESHRKGGAEISISTYSKPVTIDLGVLKSKDGLLTEYLEKPTETFHVSMGVYAMKKSCLDLIPAGRPFDFPHLIQAMLSSKRPVRSIPFSGFWLDIGRPSDYENAQKEFEARKATLLPQK